MLMDMAERTFADWLASQLKAKDWTQADFARISGLSNAQVSRMMNGLRAGEDAAMAVARAFRLPPEQVFRLAGILPATPKSDPLIEEGLHILRELDGEDREDALRYLRLRLSVADERGGKNARSRKARPLSA